MQKLIQVIKPSIILENTILKQDGGQLYDKINDKYCALGVILNSMGYHLDGNTVEFDGMVHGCYSPILDQAVNASITSLGCPADRTCNTGRGLSNVIMHLNDFHRWTFKEIGMYLRNIGY